MADPLYEDMKSLIEQITGESRWSDSRPSLAYLVGFFMGILLKLSAEDAAVRYRVHKIVRDKLK